MNTRRNLIAATAVMALLAGCTTNPYTGEQQAGKAGIYGGIGAVTGAAIGAATSSKKDRAKGALIGAAVGGAAGGGYGYYVDTQEAKLRQTLQGTGVQVQRNGDDLKLIMPGNITFASNSADISSSFYPVAHGVSSLLKRATDMRKLQGWVVEFLKQEDGPTAVEYAVMLALIVIVCLTAIQAIGNNANAKFGEVRDALQ